MAKVLQAKHDLWSLVLGSVYINPYDLADAMNEMCDDRAWDFRTRVLLRDSLLALEHRWGVQKTLSNLSSFNFDRLSHLKLEDLGERGFASLEQRLMEPTNPETIEQFLRELGSEVRETCSLRIGGSSALMLLRMLSRRTDDLDVVNEVPAPIRNDHRLMDDLVKRFGLRLTHFQSHYLPDGWEMRLRSFGSFGQVQVYLVDPVDIALGKMFSRREKDRDDLRILVQAMGKDALIERFKSSASGLLADEKFKQNAERNWYILFGEPLPA